MRWEESLNVNSIIVYGLGFQTKQKGESKNSLNTSTHCSLIPDSEHMVTSCLKLLLLWLSYHCGWRYLVIKNQNSLFLPHSTYFEYCVIAMKKVTNMPRFHTCYGNDIPQSYITAPHHPTYYHSYVTCSDIFVSMFLHLKWSCKNNSKTNKQKPFFLLIITRQQILNYL